MVVGAVSNKRDEYRDSLEFLHTDAFQLHSLYLIVAYEKSESEFTNGYQILFQVDLATGLAIEEACYAQVRISTSQLASSVPVLNLPVWNGLLAWPVFVFILPGFSAMKIL